MATGILVAGMLVSGACNSLLNKYQDKQCVGECDTDHPKIFEQPVIQTAMMFLGEMACLLAFQMVKRYNSSASKHSGYKKLKPSEALDSGIAFTADEPVSSLTKKQHIDSGRQQGQTAAHGATPNPIALVVDADCLEQGPVPDLVGWKRLLFWLPAIFDLSGTTIMNVGLLYTPVSIYQMTRSALVLWVGLFSVLYLGRRLTRAEILALLVVTLGVFVVGLSGSSKTETETEDTGRILLGIGLVLFAQTFTAAQFVVEEKIMLRYQVEPLRAVGLEGFFGFVTTLVLMEVLYLSIGRKAEGQHGYFDIPSGIHQVVENRSVWMSSIAICFSIGLFNFFGLAVTKSVSATARSTIDCCRTILIWFVSMSLGWEQFRLLQLVGFFILAYGTFVFNGVLSFPFIAPKSKSVSPSRETTPLLEDQH